MIREKELYQYRRALIAAEGSRFNRCKFCQHKQVISSGIGIRCQVLGLDHSRRFAIEDNFVCDKFVKGNLYRGEN